MKRLVSFVAAFYLFGLSFLSVFAATSLPEKASAPLIKGKAGENFPYGKTYPFEDIEFMADRDHGTAVKILLPKKIIAYLILPPGYSKMQATATEQCAKCRISSKRLTLRIMVYPTTRLSCDSVQHMVSFF